MLYLINFNLTIILLMLSQNQTLIAIKAPHASTIEVLDPDEVGIVGRCGFGICE